MENVSITRVASGADVLKGLVLDLTEEHVWVKFYHIFLLICFLNTNLFSMSYDDDSFKHLYLILILTKSWKYFNCCAHFLN